MKIKIVVRILGRLLKILAVLMIIPGAISAYYNETLGVMAFAMTAFLALCTGMLMERYGIEDELGPKEAVGVVVFGWLLISAFGALPFIFMGIDVMSGLFESMSGFTATGATILTEHDALGYYKVNTSLVDHSLSATSYQKIGNLSTWLSDNSTLVRMSSESTNFGLLFWRSFSQLIGGLGIILLYIAILPQLGVAGRQLYRAEVVGPTKDTITPRAKETARILWGIYLLLIAIETVLLLISGMPLFDSLCSAFSSLATGGFSPRSDSIAAYSSPTIDAIVALFIFFGATNFALHYKLLHKDFKSWIEDSELRLFLAILGAATIVLVLFGGIEGDAMTRFRFASFQVMSFMGTCGFVNTLEYDSWTTAAKLTLIIVMLIGGCAGSTAGGIKVARVLVVMKYAHLELLHMLHPRVLKPVKLGDTPVKEDVLRPILFYSFFYLASFFMLSLLMAIACIGNRQVDLVTVLSAVASCMAGVGPGFGVVTFDFSAMPPMAKFIGYFCMYIGRLEIMPVILLLIPDLWKD